MREPLVIVGASVRAAAQSAVRAGFAPHAADLFGDVDLGQTCPTTHVAEYPQGLVAACAAFPAGPWLYTGALENQPRLVDRLAAERRLLGNSGSVLGQVRDPFLVAKALDEAGLPSPRIAKFGAPISTALSNEASQLAWLRKPISSAGGARITVWNHPEPGSQTELAVPLRQRAASAPDAHWYLQELIAGMCASAVYVAAGSRARFLGATGQLVGESWTGASPFGYCGSIGPLALSAEQHANFVAIGNCLAERFELCGLFGVDAIINDRGVWPVEVNPRYTASIEVLERSLGLSAIGLHVAACRNLLLPVGIYSESGTANIFCGKAVLYAERALAMPAGLVERMLATNAQHSWPQYADIPVRESRIESLWPIATVLASGKNRADVLQQLKTLARDLQKSLDDLPVC